MFGGMSIRARLAIGILAAVVGVLVVLTPVQLGRLSATISEAERRELTAAYHALNATISLRAGAGQEMATLVATLPETQRAFAAGDRDRLRTMFSPAFSELHRAGTVDQFQFHTPESHSFLRLHLLDRWGDDLSSFRHTVNEANRARQAVTGLEHGVAGLGIRSVVPVTFEGRHLGTVEFGMNVTKGLAEEFKHRFDYDVAIHLPTGKDGTMMVAASTGPVRATPDEVARAMAEGMETQVFEDGTRRVARIIGPLYDFAGQPIAVAEIAMNADVYAAWYAGTWLVSLGIGVVGLFGGAVMALGLAHSLSRPLVRVAKVMRKLGDGDFANPVPGTDRQDEIGALARSAEVFRQKSVEVQRLRRMEQQMAAIVRGSHDAIIGQSPDGVVTTWNDGARETFGHGEGEMVGRDFTLLFPPERVAEVQSLSKAVALGSCVSQHETEGITKTGQKIALWLSMAPQVGPDGSVVGISAICRDFTDRKSTERALTRVNRAMRTLSGGNQALVHAESEPALLQSMCDVIVKTGGYAAAWVMFTAKPAGMELQAWASRGGEPPCASTCPNSATPSCPACSSLAQPSAVNIDNPTCASPRVGLKSVGAEQGRALLALALRVGIDPPFGSLLILSDDIPAFDAEEIRLLREMSGDLAFGIVTMRMHQAKYEADKRLERALERTIQAVAATVEVRDPYTAGHQRRVAEIAVAIARAMGLPEDRVKGIMVAGLIHDIGKISIPSEVLSRPGKLSAVEFELVKTHTQTGYDIICDVEFPWPVAEAVLQHHERLDGSGYPNGLSGDQIPLEARVLAVADVAEAISSHRPYRASLGLDAAIEELKSGSGSRYDPKVVETFLTIAQDVLAAA